MQSAPQTHLRPPIHHAQPRPVQRSRTTGAASHRVWGSAQMVRSRHDRRAGHGLRRSGRHPPLPGGLPDSQADAGTTTMAVVAVERWEDIAGALRPNFSLTGDTAVAERLPETEAATHQAPQQPRRGPERRASDPDVLPHQHAHPGHGPSSDRATDLDQHRAERHRARAEDRRLTGRQAGALPTGDPAGAILKPDPHSSTRRRGAVPRGGAPQPLHRQRRAAARLRALPRPPPDRRHAHRRRASPTTC